MPFFGTSHARDHLAQDLVLHGLFAEHALQLTHLVLQQAVFAGRDHFATGAGRGQRAALRLPAPTKQLVGRNTMKSRHMGHAHAGKIGFFDDAELLFRGPAPTALNPSENLRMHIVPRLTVGHIPHSYISVRSCPGNSGAASVDHMPVIDDMTMLAIVASAAAHQGHEQRAAQEQIDPVIIEPRAQAVSD